MARLLRMPEIAANAVDAVLSGWPVPENASFTAQDAIATVETDKAVVDIPADADGIILRTLVTAGTTVAVGAPIAVLGDPGETVADLDALLADLGVGPAARTPNGHPGRTFASPLARRLARDAGLPIDDLTGTGPGGRIVRRDVQRAISERPTPAPAAVVPAPAVPVEAAGYRDVPHSRTRRAIAARLAESSRDVPQFEIRGSARVDRLLRLRARLNEHGPVSVSVNDLVVMAAARAHLTVPEMNVVWMPDAVRSFSSVDIAVAVATDRGLVTPVLRGVDRLSASTVASATADLVARARAGRLREDELTGGTLTVSNLGGHGTEDFSAIINPPHAAILAVGAARPEPVVRKGKAAVGTVMRVTLSVDHRPVDGVVAARWMAAFLGLVADPLRILA
jgi:pyruvate dehydrogenase E2 component (dihydrolipoamide acetyltransferase)